MLRGPSLIPAVTDSADHEAWIAADSFRGGVRALVTGPQGFERTVAFALDEAPKRIAIPAARRRMAAAQRKRRAAARKPKAATPTPAKAAGRKRRLNPAGRARIIAATKKRWAAQKKAASRSWMRRCFRPKAARSGICRFPFHSVLGNLRQS
jgi:hypothetical protein